MIEDDLDKRFQEAVEIASFMKQASLPQDVQLRLYAFYKHATFDKTQFNICLLYTSPSPRDRQKSRMPSSA